MKKVCIIACSLLMAATLTLGIVSSVVNVPQEDITLCDMAPGRVSF